MGRTHARSPTEVRLHQLTSILHMVTTTGMALYCFINFVLEKKNLS